MNVKLTGSYSHPGKLFSVDVWVCLNPIAKVRFSIYIFSGRPRAVSIPLA